MTDKNSDDAVRQKTGSTHGMPEDDRHVVVWRWDEIDDAPEVSDAEKQRVATIFNEQSWRYVVWLPEWLLEDPDKDIETLESADHLAVGDVENYSGKAWQFTQPHRRNSPGGYLPKSAVVVFERLNPDVEIQSPQQGLSAYTGGGADA